MTTFDYCWENSDFLFSSMPVSLTEKIHLSSSDLFIFQSYSKSQVTIRSSYVWWENWECPFWNQDDARLVTFCIITFYLPHISLFANFQWQGKMVYCGDC